MVNSSFPSPLATLTPTAMQAGWIKIDKEAAAGPLVRRTKDDIDDAVQEALRKIAALNIDDVDEKLRGDLKKRKLVVEVETKYYELTKGPSFNTGRCGKKNPI